MEEQRFRKTKINFDVIKIKVGTFNKLSSKKSVLGFAR